jgi:nitroreductase
MNVTSAILARKSVRAYLPNKPVPVDLIKDILIKAQKAPSGGNLQPWRVFVVDGKKRDLICQEIQDLISQGILTQETEYDIYPKDLTPLYKDRRTKGGNDLYSTIGVAKTDLQSKLAQLRKNWNFFGAPMGVYFVVDRQMNSPQWSDVGGYIVNFALLCEEAGLATCYKNHGHNFI